MLPYPTVTCLVISRSADLLNRLLNSLQYARLKWGATDEVLCSWNGSQEDETRIEPPNSGPGFRIAARTAYHFATNMNNLADQASGEVLILLNDDLILDPGSLDQALQILYGHSGIGLVGARLRTPEGLLGHAGILFGATNLPYNRLRPERLGTLLEASASEPPRSGEIPAVTGALMAVRRQDFCKVRMRESFHICGEDVALCLDLRRQLGLATYYAATVGAVHAEKSSRGHAVDQHDDQQLASVVAQARAEDPSLEGLIARWASEEVDVLEQLLRYSQECLRKSLADLGMRDQQWTSCLKEHEAALKQLQKKHKTELDFAAHEHELERTALLSVQHRLEKELHSLRKSRSWSLTAPYRLAGGWLSRLRSRS